MKRVNSLLLLLLIIFVSSCNQGTSTTELGMSTPPAAPEQGMTTVTGRVVSNESGKPKTDTIIRLAGVVRQGDEGAFVLDVAFSPGALSDENGNFIFENVKPLEYVIVIGDVEDIYEVVTDEEGKPKTWETQADQVVDVGEIRVNLTP